MRIVIISIICFISLQIYAQTFRPIDWTSENIIWSTYSIVPEIETQVLYPRMRFHNHNLPLMEDGYIYNVANIFSGDQYYNGYFVQKIDMETGTEVWQNSRFFKFVNNSNPDREYAASPYLKNGNLAFHFFKEFAPNRSFLWLRGSLGKAGYDVNNGEPTDYQLTDPTDSKNKIIFTGKPGFFRDVFLFEEDSTTNYVVINRLCPVNCEQLNLASYVLNNDGHAIDSSINVINMGRFIDRIQTYMILENKLLVVVQCPATIEGEKDIVRIMVTDYDMNVESDIDIADKLPPRKKLSNLSLDISALAGDKFNLHAQYIDSNLVIYNFDIKGNLLEEISLSLPISTLRSLPMQSDKGSIVCISEQKPEQTSFKIFQSDGAGNLTLKEELKSADPTDSYGISSLFWTPDKNLLLHISQIDINQLNEFTRMDWLSNVLIDTRKLGIISSTSEQGETLIPTIYPNPTTDYITLPELKNNMKAVIYSMDGKQLLNSNIINNNQIDVSSLPNGVYHLKVINNNFTHKYKFVKH